MQKRSLKYFRLCYLLRLDKVYAPLFHEVKLALQKIEYRSLSHFGKKSLHQMALYFQLVEGDPSLMEAFQLRGSLNYENPAWNGRPSWIEKKMSQELLRQGVDFTTEYRTEIGYFVDFYVPAKNLVIQTDGPDHFYVDENGESFLKFSDQRIDEMLKAAGYDVLRVHYSFLQE